MAKAKRRLSNFDFTGKGCHLSLVGPSLGGPANGRTVLKIASLNKEAEGTNVEMIEKSAVDALVLKAVEEAVAPVQKALQEANEQIEVFKAAQVEAIEKSRKEALAAVMGSENPELETEFAILKSLDDAAFQIVIKSKAAAAEAVNKSEMFKEIGVAGEAEIKDQPQESAEMRVLKQKHQPK